MLKNIFKCKERNGIKTHIGILVCVLAVALFFLLIGNVVSKYVYNNGGKSVALAHEFFFESNYLAEDGKEYILSPGCTSVDVTLKNFPDELRYATTQVDYVLTVKEKESDMVLLEKTGFLEGIKKSEATETVPVQSGKTYEVTASGNGGFFKKLKATFVVMPENSGIYKYAEDYDEYVLLTVWSENISGDVGITFPVTLLPDNTDDAMATALCSDGKLIDEDNFVKAFSSHNYRFFKTNGELSYTADSFIVSCGEVTATVKRPER